jgi:hypothetical protein
MEYFMVVDMLLKIIIAACIVALVYGGKKLLEELQYISNSSQISADKLSFCERRLERLMETGQETCRHLTQLVHEFDLQRANGSLQWARRRTLGVYGEWRFARQLQKADYSDRMWQLVVVTAVVWIRTEIEDILQYDQTEGQRLQTNISMFQSRIAEYWSVCPTCSDPMQEFHKLENVENVKMGILLGDAKEHGVGVSFRSRLLQD